MGDAIGPDVAAGDDHTSESISPDEISTDEEFADALRMLHKTTKLSISEVASRSGLSEASLQGMLSTTYVGNTPSLRLLLPALGLSPREIAPWVKAAERLSNPISRVPVSGTTAAEQAARRELAKAERELTDAEELTLPALWKVTHARLDYYHEIATGQARQSFRNAQIAMATGFILLVGFAVLAFFARTTTGAIVAGTLGAVATTFAAYISRTFVRSQESSAAHLRSYFGQPLEFSRYLAAERLLHRIEKLEPEQRATLASDVLRGILLGSVKLGDEATSPGEQ
ncbi:hypothetical protein ACIBO2_54685 [Nonomuraea sp. NPDC050022]|uniref:TRADD-N-associated membrane domain-containing protein n=1 Tax=unclassified Nonomuraea TaxID=2593643 RepID=UPI0033D091A4